MVSPGSRLHPNGIENEHSLPFFVVGNFVGTKIATEVAHEEFDLLTNECSA